MLLHTQQGLLSPEGVRYFRLNPLGPLQPIRDRRALSLSSTFITLKRHEKAAASGLGFCALVSILLGLESPDSWHQWVKLHTLAFLLLTQG